MPNVGARRRIAAWIALPLFACALAVIVQALGRNTIPIIVGLVGLGIATGADWWLITDIGIRRVVGGIGSVIGTGLVVVAFVQVAARPEHVLLRVLLIATLVTATLALARYSLLRPVPKTPTASGTGRELSHPVLLCNPWSGGGKVEQFGLVEMAEDLGVEVVMLDHGLDLEDLTRDAVARGADCLGMAGGDGSQALVASVAAEHDLPYVCIPAGTRNHFALDLGLDRTDPRSAMYAYRDAVERRVDFATVNDRLFVNNVSLGVYATIVQSDDYRDAKVDVTRSMLTDLLGRQSEPFDLEYTAPDGTEVSGAFLIMVSNNPYVLGTSVDVSQRRRMDGGALGVFAVSTSTGSQAARLVMLSALGLRNISKHWYEFTTDEFEVRSQSGLALMGVDGEALEETTPLRFRIHAQGLRLFVPEGNLVEIEKRRARDLHLVDVVRIAAGREPASSS
ncbi:MAG: diacylglycerol kinase family protein [Actinomycetota bacterium]